MSTGLNTRTDLVFSIKLNYHKNMNQAVEDQIAILKDLILETFPVEQIYLFGSHANGTPTNDSDLDMYVIMKDDAPLPEIEAEQKIALAFIGKKTMPADILVSKKQGSNIDYQPPLWNGKLPQKAIVLCTPPIIPFPLKKYSVIIIQKEKH